MRILISFAVALLCLTACSDSKSNAITAAEVARALRSQGFTVSIATGDAKDTYRQVFAQDLGAVRDVVVSGKGGWTSYGPSHQPTVSDLGLTALVYENESDASCSRSNVMGVCLRKRNVVIVVRDAGAPAARHALAKLG